MLGQVFVFVLFLLLAKPGTAGLLLLLGLLHCYARHAPITQTERKEALKLVGSSQYWVEEVMCVYMSHVSTAGVFPGD